MKTRTVMAALAVALGTTAIAVPAFADRGMMQGRMHGMMGGMMGQDGPHGMMPDFATLDADGDGSVTEAEILAWRQGKVEGLDANGDGLLSAEELVAQEMKQAQVRAEAKVARQIAAQDLDGDGALSAAELMAPPMPMQLFDRADADGDGAVSVEEFEAAKAKMAEKMRGGDRDGERGGRGKDRDARGHGGQHGKGQGMGGQGGQGMGGQGMNGQGMGGQGMGGQGGPGAVPPIAPDAAPAPAN